MDQQAAAVGEHFRSKFPVERDGAQLACWEGLQLAPGVGLVASFHLYESGTIQGPSADLVVVPEAQLDRAESAVDELLARIGALDLPAALARPLTDSLGLA